MRGVPYPPLRGYFPTAVGKQGETTGDLFRLGFADPPPMGLTGPSSLENVHWTFSRALGPPEGKARMDKRKNKPSPLGKVARPEGP